MRKFSLLAVVWFLAMGLFGFLAPSANADIKGNKNMQAVNFMPEKGFQIDSQQTKEVFGDFAQVGGNTIVLNPILEQDNIHSTEIWNRSDSPTMSQLQRAIDHARATKGITRIVVKPHIEVRNHDWRARIAFDNNKDADEWQKNYTAWLLQYAKMPGVTDLVIGTEQRGTVTKGITLKGKKIKFNKNNPKRWINTTIKPLRKAAPKVKLTYAAHTSDECKFLDKAFVRQLDYLSLTYYPRPNFDTKDVSVSAFKKSIGKDKKQFFDVIHKRFKAKNGKKTNIVFMETGFRSITLDAYFKKSNEVGKKDVNLQLQVNQYEAFFYVMNKTSYVKGVALYRWSNVPWAGGPDDPWFTTQNKPANKVVEKYFK